ncbi:hypothetical protein ADUPG1_004839, partial [Aduncisulcus paluster]
LDAVLTRAEELNLRLKPSKCKFGVSQVEFLGREVSSSGIRVAESRIQDLKELKAPKNKKQTQQILGLFNYYRSFIRNYALRVACLTELTRKFEKFSWNEQRQKAFEDIKADIIRRTLMFHIDYSKDIILQTDASDRGVGGVLFQVGHQGDIEPVMFMSHTLS